MARSRAASAAEIKAWPEFEAGSGYTVDLASRDGSERVSVRFIPGTADEFPYVSVSAAILGGPLFDRVLGRVTAALAAHSDNLQVRRLS